jgi:hypothetical protein
MQAISATTSTASPTLAWPELGLGRPAMPTFTRLDGLSAHVQTSREAKAESLCCRKVSRAPAQHSAIVASRSNVFIIFISG